MFQSGVAGSTSVLGRWLATHGAGFDEALTAEQGPSGFSWRASHALPTGTQLVCCPFELVITPSLCRDALAPFLTRADHLSNRQLMATYVALHKCVPDQPTLAHLAYVNSLPDRCRTPLYFNEAELEVLRGTNMYGATLDRRKEWEQEWSSVRDSLSGVSLPWALFLWACTMISSRAFSSTLLPATHPDAADATPILIPGVDVLDHSPRARVLWQTDVEKGTIAIHTDAPLAAGSEVLNNYGPKPNEELVLGYGFALPSNEADIVALKLVVPASHTDLALRLNLTNERHLLGRHSGIPAELLAVIRLLVSSDDERAHIEVEAQSGTWQEALAFVSSENELDALDTLTEMLDAKLLAIKEPRDYSVFADEITADMVAAYIRGQAEVLESALESCEKLMQEAMERAEAEEET